MQEGLLQSDGVEIVDFSELTRDKIVPGVMIEGIGGKSGAPIEDVLRILEEFAQVLGNRQGKQAALSDNEWIMMKLKETFEKVDRRFYGRHIPFALQVLPSDLSIVPNTNSRKSLSEEQIIRFLFFAKMKSTKLMGAKKGIIGISAVECGLYMHRRMSPYSPVYFHCRTYKMPKTRQAVNELLADSRRLALEFYRYEFKNPIPVGFETSKRR